MLLKVVAADDSRDYSYITVSAYPSPAAIQNEDFNGAVARALSADELEGLEKRTNEARELIRSDQWRMESNAMSEGRHKNPNMFLDFMKPAAGRAAEYAAAEREVFRKQHQALIDAGLMSAWSFNSLRSARSADAPYEFVTVNVFPRRDENATKSSRSSMQSSRTGTDAMGGRRVSPLDAVARRSRSAER